MEAPKAYAMQDPSKPMNVITIDCRGLEFVEFKPDVCVSTSRCQMLSASHHGRPGLTASGRVEGGRNGVRDEVQWY